MLATYPAIYRDRFGEEATTIENDGATLCMVIRGTEFTGWMLDDWEPVASGADSQLLNFPLHRGELCSFTLDCEIPVPMIEAGQAKQASLRVHLELGEPHANGGVDREELRLELVHDARLYKSSGKSGYFEDELSEIQAMLPTGANMKCCFTCAYSDYNPAGHGLFGGLICFRNHKQEYLSLTGKRAVFQLIEKTKEIVQEIYLCPEFEKRVPGTGYRG